MYAQQDLYPTDERKEMALYLIKNISLDKSPSLQDELLIIYLHHKEYATEESEDYFKICRSSKDTKWDIPLDVSLPSLINEFLTLRQPG